MTTELTVPRAWRQLSLAVAVLVGVYLVVFGPSVLTALSVLLGRATPAATAGGWDTLAAVESDVFSVAVVGVVVLRWLPRHAPDVTSRMRLGRTRVVPGGLLGASAAFVAVVMVSTWLGDRFVTGLGLPPGPSTQVDEGWRGLLVGGTAGVAAGITEEIVLVALASAVVTHSGLRNRWVVPATLAVLIVLRWLPHAYYRWDSVFVLLWVPGVYLLYRWAGSVRPLIVGHVGYDVLAVAGRAYPASTRAIDTILWSLAAAGTIVLTISAVRPLLQGSTPAVAANDRE